MTDLLHIPFNRIDGTPATLEEYSDKVVLIVNVASKCGLTPQYASLEAFYEARHAQGLVILGFPANNFAGQEPGSNEEIAQFCSLNYGVSFPLFAKISVKGADRHPLYAALTEAAPHAVSAPDSTLAAALEAKGVRQAQPSDVLWNFEKFLLAPGGAVIGRFGPDVTVDNALLRDAIDEQLTTKAAR